MFADILHCRWIRDTLQDCVVALDLILLLFKRPLDASAIALSCEPAAVSLCCFRLGVSEFGLQFFKALAAVKVKICSKVPEIVSTHTMYACDDKHMMLDDV